MAAKETVAGAKVVVVNVERYGAESKLHLVVKSMRHFYGKPLIIKKIIYPTC